MGIQKGVDGTKVRLQPIRTSVKSHSNQDNEDSVSAKGLGHLHSYGLPAEALMALCWADSDCCPGFPWNMSLIADISGTLELPSDLELHSHNFLHHLRI